MKKWFSLFVMILFTLSIFGCSPDPVVPSDDSPQAIEKVNQDVESEQVKTTEETKVEDETKQEEKGNNQQEREENVEQVKDETTKERPVETENKGNDKEPSTAETDQSKNNTQPTTEKDENKQIEETTEPKDTVTISIIGLNDPIVPSMKVEINPDDTILSVTIRLLKEKGIQYEYSGKGATAYVHGINNLYEMDEGPLSGWLYKKNGVIISRSAGIEPVQKGDIIEWFYTEDYTKYSQ